MRCCSIWKFGLVDARRIWEGGISQNGAIIARVIVRKRAKKKIGQIYRTFIAISPRSAQNSAKIPPQGAWSSVKSQISTSQGARASYGFTVWPKPPAYKPMAKLARQKHELKNQILI